MGDSLPSDYRDYVIKDGELIGEFELMYQNVEDPWGAVRNVGSLKNDLLLALIRHLGSSENIERILHAGCALGALTSRVSAALGTKTKVWGCDISPTAVAKASAKYGGIDFFVHDLAQRESMPFCQRFFDVILLTDTMWYILPSLEAIFQQFHNKLRPGGHLILKQYFLPPGEQEYGNDIVQTPDDLIKFVTHAGFKVQHRIEMDASATHILLLWATS